LRLARELSAFEQPELFVRLTRIHAARARISTFGNTSGQLIN
jgi:hypothetical protein